MRLIFKRDKNIIRANYLYGNFGPPNALPLAAKRAPALFGKSFYEASEIVFDIGKLKQGYRTLFKYLFNEKLDRATELKCKKIVKRMEKSIYVPKEYNPNLLKEVEDKFKEIYTKKEVTIGKEIKNFFGFELPKTTTIALNGAFYSSGKHNSGGELFATKDNIVMSWEVSYNIDVNDIDGIFAMFIHELLHGLIEQNNVRIDKDNSWFEEAVLDYFAPHGILGQRLGFIKKEDIKKYLERNIGNRPYSEYMAKKLLPHMRNYYNNKQKETIWRFLAKRGFKRYIKTII